MSPTISQYHHITMAVGEQPKLMSGYQKLSRTHEGQIDERCLAAPRPCMYSSTLVSIWAYLWSHHVRRVPIPTSGI